MAPRLYILYPWIDASPLHPCLHINETLFILLCFPSQVTFPFSRVISIHHYSSTLILSATLIPHSFSLPPTSENVVIRDNSLQLPTTLPTNLNQSSPPPATKEVASLSLSPVPSLAYILDSTIPFCLLRRSILIYFSWHLFMFISTSPPSLNPSLYHILLFTHLPFPLTNKTTTIHSWELPPLLKVSSFHSCFMKRISISCVSSHFQPCDSISPLLKLFSRLRRLQRSCH